MSKKIKIIGKLLGIFLLVAFSYCVGWTEAVDKQATKERDLLALVGASYKAGANDVIFHPNILAPDSILQSLQFLETNRSFRPGQLTGRYQVLTQRLGEPSQ